MPKNAEEDATEFVETWNNSFIFLDYDVNKRLYIITLRNQNGNVISSKSIDEKVFGRSFCENPNEHRKLRNSSIFLLGREDNNVLITELPLKELFNQIH